MVKAEIPACGTVLERKKMLYGESGTEIEDEEQGQKVHIPCSKNDAHQAAVYCKNCQKDFCMLCFNSRHSLEKFRSHSQVPLAKKPIVLPKCPEVHEDEDKNNHLAEFICMKKSCKKAIFCRACLLTHHKSHAREDLAELLEKNLEQLKNDMTRIKIKRENLKYEILKNEQRRKMCGVHSVDFEAKVEAIERDFGCKKTEAIEELKKNAKIEATELKEVIKSLQEKDAKALEIEQKLAVLVLSTSGLHDVDEVHKQAMEVYEQRTPKKKTGFLRNKI